ncbi:MAG: hypothetical protein J6U05_00090 [Neisseriaceae bacterium]|nr:hypothetical protein [Neisseriaceae bacterium]MBO7554657.1 hypothetical protein [Neisseriaceae bacterium]
MFGKIIFRLPENLSVIASRAEFPAREVLSGSLKKNALLINNAFFNQIKSLFLRFFRRFFNLWFF